MCATHTETSGGSSETEVNELAVSPTGLPSTSAATAVTPDGKAPNTRRSWAGSRRATVTTEPLGSAGAIRGDIEQTVR